MASSRPAPRLPLRGAIFAVDVAVGASARAAAPVVAVGRGVRAATSPLATAVSRAPLPGTSVVPGALLGGLAARGESVRRGAGRRVSDALDVVVPAVVGQVVPRVDITGIVEKYVDIDRIAEGMDLVSLTNEVIEKVDLPEIIRESTGSVASETLRGVRMQSISGDDAVTRIVDRFRLRHRVQVPVVPSAPGTT